MKTKTPKKNTSKWNIFRETTLRNNLNKPLILIKRMIIIMTKIENKNKKIKWLVQ